MKKFLLSLIFFACLSIVYTQTIPKLPNTISVEQKLYELSMIWKEVVYNLDNFQNDDQQNLDILYRSYIPKIMETANDLDYYKTMQQFLAHCNNGHTNVWDFNNSNLDTLIARPYLQTIYREGKIYVENIADYHAENLNIGDEIMEINQINAVDYIKQYFVPYFSVTNEEDKIHRAMFARGLGYFFSLNTPFILKVQDVTTHQLKTVTIYADRTMNDSGDKWIEHNFNHVRTNFFYQDTIKRISYIRIVENSQESAIFFANHISEISQSKNIILDLAEDWGGSSTYNNVIYNYLINKDSIESVLYTSRFHSPAFKGLGKDYCLGKYGDNKDVVDYYCTYYQGTAYSSLYPRNFQGKQSTVPDRFQGNVYVIIGRNCGSAGEDLAAMLAQDEKIIFLGGKTSGCMGRPYVVNLPSGLEVFIETQKVYNVKQEDISAGLSPHYYIDFYDCYKTNSPQLLLDCLWSKIENVLK